MTAILDAGALVAVDRDDRSLLAALVAARNRGIDFRTSVMVLAQVWRDGRGRQANLARFLASVEIVGVDEMHAREAGVLLGRARRDDAIDAVVALLAQDGDTIVTSDAADLRHLVTTLGRRVTIVPC